MMERIHAFFVDRPLLVNLTMVLAVVAGVFALVTARYQTMPTFDLGVVNITTLSPGASPEDVELSITAPIEEELLDVDGLDKVLSSSMEGMSMVVARMDASAGEVEQRRILGDVQKAVDRAAGRLPADLPRKPLVEALSSKRVPVMEVNITGTVPEETLRKTARQLQNGLREVTGIAGVLRDGYRKRELKIDLRPDALHRLGITQAEIVQAIGRRNVRDSGGSLESFTAEKKVLTVGQFARPEEVADVIVRQASPGNYVRLRDVADVILDYEDWQVQARSDGKLSIALMPKKKADADGLRTAEAVRAYLEQARSSLPPGVEVSLVNDISRFTVDMLDMLRGNAIMGFFLVVVALLLFFRLRLALWVGIGLPVAVALTFALMPLFDLNVDVMTLTVLILLLGMLVDDAIVTGEAIYAYREQGLPPREAAIRGVGRVAGPVFVSSLTTVLAFAPVAFLGGLEGKFLWALPVMAVLALGASIIECQFMLPAHLAHGGEDNPKPKQWFLRIQQVYDRWAVRMVRRRYLTILVFVAASFAIFVLGALTVRFNLYPEMEVDTLWVRVELPEGASFEHTGKRVREVEGLVRQVVPERDLLNVTTRVGHHDTDIYGMTEGRNSAWALLTVYMKPLGQRQVNTHHVVAELRRRVTELEGFESIVVEPLDDAPVAGKPVEVSVIGSAPEGASVADSILGFLQHHPAVTESWSSYKPGKDVVRLALDHEALADRGLSVLEITQAVRLAFDGMVVDELRTTDETVDLRLQLHPNDRGRLSTLRSLVLHTAGGDAVPLRAVADLQVEPGQASIRRYFGERSVTVYAEIDRMTMGAAEINDQVRDFVRAEGLLSHGSSVRLHYGGELEQQQEALGNVAVAFAMCLLGIFFVLVVLFGSVTQPVLLMAVLPFSLTGVVVAFMLHGMELSMIALIGILGLLGVLVNDSLVLITHLNRKRGDSGRLTDEEVADGTGERLRPIIITSLTTLAALAPAAYGLAGSHPFMTPMIMAIAWGVAFGVPVTLVLLPCLYAVHQDVTGAIRKLWRRVRPQAS